MIVVDVQALQSVGFAERGIGRYVTDLTLAIAERHPGLVDAFAWNDRLPNTRALDALRSVPAINERLVPFSQLRGCHVELLHVGAPFDDLGHHELAVPVRARRLVATCYDLIPYRFPDVYLPGAIDRARYLTRLGLLQSSDAVLAISASAGDDAVELGGIPRTRVHVVGAGVGERFTPPAGSRADVLRDLRHDLPAIEASFVLVPTGFTWRKNIDGTLRAFADLSDELRERHQLVVVCSLDDGARAWLADEIARLGLTDRVLITGHVDDDTLVALYQAAELVFLPSYYEGFGLPVLEARRCGARVICSGVSSLPEVLPDERALFDPWDHDDVVETLRRALTDPGFAAVLDAVPDPGFDWGAAADSVAAVYREMVGSPQEPEVRPKRLGVVTVLPPAASGIADHSERLVGALHASTAVEIEVFADGAARRSDGVTIHPVADLPERWASGDLDAVLYVVGDNRLHRRAARLMRTVPGHVLLHDVRVANMYTASERARIVADHYGGDDPERPPLFAAPVAGRAVSVMVQSAHAADLVRTDTGVEAVNVGPHPCAQVEPGPGVRGAPLVVSAGFATPEKQSDKVAAAMRDVAARGLARCAFVGKWGEHFVERDDPIETTGAVGDDDFVEWIAKASVMVQLRATTNGESSGVVAYALARGTPLIVSDIGAMSELPDDAVVKVPVDIEPEALAEAIADLLADQARRKAMREAALAYAARETPEAQARRVVALVFAPD